MAIQTEHSLRLGVEIKKKLKEFDLDISFERRKRLSGYFRTFRLWKEHDS